MKIKIETDDNILSFVTEFYPLYTEYYEKRVKFLIFALVCRIK